MTSTTTATHQTGAGRLDGKVVVITGAASAKTALTRDLYEDMTFMKEFADSVPLKRWGEMSDVANLALFLASDESSYIHGDLVRIDGGETLCRYSV